jgi:hypothetical protein
MSSELVPVPRERDVALLETAAADVVEAWLDGRCQNTRTAYLRDIRHFATFLKAPTPADAIEQFLAVGQAGANRLALAYRALK